MVRVSAREATNVAAANGSTEDRTGDLVQYDPGSKAERIERGRLRVVRSSDDATNRLIVEMVDGSISTALL